MIWRLIKDALSAMPGGVVSMLLLITVLLLALALAVSGIAELVRIL